MPLLKTPLCLANTKPSNYACDAICKNVVPFVPGSIRISEGIIELAPAHNRSSIISSPSPLLLGFFVFWDFCCCWFLLVLLVFCLFFACFWWFVLCCLVFFFLNLFGQIPVSRPNRQHDILPKC